MKLNSQARPVIFGEVLFDVFPGGEEVLGGAPFNVAWNLQGLGLEPLFISRVGDDKLGRQVRQSMASWGMDTRGLQVDAERPTGVVQVTLRNGQPDFNIIQNTAYDCIEADTALSALRNVPCSLVYHGTVVVRSQASRAALETLVREHDLPRFVDLNLRAPWWDTETVRRAVEGASWVKLNDQEVATLTGRELSSEEDLLAAAREVCPGSPPEVLTVTRGERGALLFKKDGTVSGTSGVPVKEIADTVGAGDAFSAVLILGWAQGWPEEVSLKRAAEFAAAICRIRGATVMEEGFYLYHLVKWTEDDHGG